MIKTNINLYPVSCHPQRPVASFMQFVALVAFCSVVFGGISFTLDYQQEKLNLKIKEQAQVQKETNQKLASLTNQLSNHKASKETQKRYAAIKKLIKDRNYFIENLKRFNVGTTIPFSSLMEVLSIVDTENVSIEQFSIINGKLNIQGKAKHSDSLPLWLEKFKETKSLAKVTFEELLLYKQKGEYSFIVHNGDLSSLDLDNAGIQNE